jgi:hypothetical protein
MALYAKTMKPGRASTMKIQSETGESKAARIRRLLNTGLTARQIAAHVSCAKTYVYLVADERKLRAHYDRTNEYIKHRYATDPTFRKAHAANAARSYARGGAQ